MLSWPPAHAVGTPPGRSLLRNADYVWYSLARAASVAGSQLTYVAYPLYALAISRSAASAGLVGLASYGSSVVAAPFSGAIADLRDRRAMMLLCDVVRAVALGILAVGIATRHDGIPLLIAVSFVSGVCTSLFTAASHSALPSIVGAPLLSRAVARNQTRDFLLSLVGPLAGAALLSLAAALPFALDSASYAASWLLMTRVRREAVAYAQDADGDRAGSIRAGLRFLLRHPLLRDAALCLAVLNLLLTGSTFGLIVITQAAGSHPLSAGAIVASQSVGAVLGSLAADRVASRSAPRTVVLVQVWLWVAVLAGFALRPPLAVLLILSGLVWSVTPALRTVLLGHLAAAVPPGYRGRLTSFVFVLGGLTLAPLGPVLFGAIAVASSPSVAMLVLAGCALILAAAVSAVSPLGRRPWPAEVYGCR